MSNSQDKKRARGSSSTAEDEDSKILERLSSIQNKIENGFTKIDGEISALKIELKGDIKSIRTELRDAVKSLNAAWVEINAIKEKNKYLQECLDSTMEENDKLKEEVGALTVRLVKQEDYSRRENLRFYNIPENPDEDNEECIQKVKDVLSELDTSADVKFHAIHRIGKRNVQRLVNRARSTGSPTEEEQPCRPRPVLVRFVSRMDCDCVWTKKKELLNSPRFSTVYIDKDLSVESAKNRSKLRAAYKKAKELKIERVFIKGNKLIVNSSSYAVNTIPDYLLPNWKESNDQRTNPS